MAYRQTQKKYVIGPPGPITMAWPRDWNTLPMYFIAPGICLILIFAFSYDSVYETNPPPLPPYLIWVIAGVLSVLPIAFFAKSAQFALQKHEFEFRRESVVVPKRWPLGSVQEFRYDQVEKMFTVKNARKYQLKDRRIIRIDSYRAGDSQTTGALDLRIGYAEEQKGNIDNALFYYEASTDSFRPTLDARIAFLYEKQDDFDESLEHLLQAFVDHELELGPEDPCTLFLKNHLDQFRKKHPDAESSWDTIDEVRAWKKEIKEDELKFEYSRNKMRDDWSPIPE